MAEATQEMASMTDETTQALLPVVPDFSRTTLQTNIESILRNSRDVHTHSLTRMIMDAIPRAAPHSESDVVAALQALFDNYKELADSGDAGFWSLEDTPVGKQALAALENARHRLAHSLPSQASDAGEVDALAEILDPFAFKSWRGMVDYCIGQGDERPDAERYADMTYGAAIAKARVNAEKAIKWIATLSPPTSGEEMRLREENEQLRHGLENIVGYYERNNPKPEDEWEDGYEDALKECASMARAALTEGAE